MTHIETSRRRVSSVPKSIACAAACALLFVACNVYDSSLLDSSALANGGAGNNGGSPILGGGATDSSSGAGNNPTGGAGNATGGIGLAGADNAGDSTGGTNTSRAGTGGAPSTAGSGVVIGGSGGTSGAGQAGGASGGVTSTSLSLIDDMETVDANIPQIDGRQGFWSVANDGPASGKQTPSPVVTMSMIPGGRGASLNAFHTTATGFTNGGALVGVDLNRKGLTRSTYDASPYNAVHFWIRVEPGSPTAMHFAILDKHTDPGGGLCCMTKTDCTGGGVLATGGLCYDHFGVDLQPLTTTWSERTVTFAELNQVGWGENNVTALDAAHVFNIQFNWVSAAMDLWIDDISFVKK